MSTATRCYTPEDLLTMPDDGPRYELVDGQLVELHMGAEADFITALITTYMQNFCIAQPVGRVVVNSSFRCFVGTPGKVRRPDAAYISFARFPADQPLPRGFFRIVPDLAVEVVSPNDLDEEVDIKIEEYLAAGVRLVWIVRPRTKRVYIHRADGSVVVVGITGELDGEDVLPGFKCPVASLFPMPPPTVM